MGISFKGHDNNWQYWVFGIDGRDWVAVNQSTPEPLNIRFQGRFRNWGGDPLSKAGGFDIVASTSRGADKDGQNQGTVEWTWNGVNYKSGWKLTAGNEIIVGDPAEGIETVWDYQLEFVGRITYDGPAGGAVGTGVVSQAVIEAAIVPSAQLSTDAPVQASPIPPKVITSGVVSQAVIEVAKTKDDRELAVATSQISPSAAKPVAVGIASPAAIQASQSGDAIQETRDAIAAAFKALSVSRSQGTVNVGSFNFARRELLNAKDALAVAKSRSTPSEQVLMSQLEEQVDTIQGEVNIQLKYLQGATQTPSGGGTAVVIPGTTMTQSPVVTGGGTTTGGGVVTGGGTTTGGGTPPAPTAVAGTDWVKLGLQLGAAYLLLS
ncbi:hypothetical protein EBX31_02945 [bacterium]|nr:hypothetical protein [bacterium]